MTETVRKKKRSLKLKTNKDAYLLNFPPSYDVMLDAFKHISNIMNLTTRIRFPIVWKFQFYTICTNRTIVDRQLNLLKDEGVLRFLKIGKNDPDYVALMLDSDYISLLRSMKNDSNGRLLDRFIQFISDNKVGLSICEKDIANVFTDADISRLIHCGALMTRVPGSWWINYPLAGYFLPIFDRGEKVILSVIRRSKTGRCLVNDLVTRKYPGKSLMLGVMYYIYGLLGNQTVSLVSSVSGPMLRVNRD